MQIRGGESDFPSHFLVNIPYSSLFFVKYLLTLLFHFVTVLAGNHHNDYLSNTLKPMSDQKISINDLPDLLTVREVAEVLRVSPLTIKRWGKRGKLPAIRINSRGDRRYKKEAVLWLLGIQEKTGGL